MTKIEEAITETWGERCPDFCDECVVCQAWAEFDQIELLREALENTSALISLMCKSIQPDADDFIIDRHTKDENGERRLVESISIKQMLNKVNAILKGAK